MRCTYKDLFSMTSCKGLKKTQNHPLRQGLLLLPVYGLTDGMPFPT